jgi:DedD protein
VNEVLKQRLVGALILVALALIFWPIVFVEPDDKPIAQPRAIPEPPVVATETIEAPDDAGLRASPELTEYGDSPESVDADTQGNVGVDGTDYVVAETEDEAEPVASASAATAPVAVQNPAAATAATGVRSESPQPLVTDGDGVPVAWTLQVATVSSAEKADALRRRLLEKGEKAYVTTISSGGKQLYRVSVGPKFERQELERIQASINAEFGVKTMLVRYLP